MLFTFPDIELLVVAYLSSFAGVNVSLETPNTLSATLPFVRVTRVAGGDDYVTDVATIDLDIFSDTRYNCNVVSQAVHGYMHRLRHTSVGNLLVDHVETVTSPMYVDYGDENLRRNVASYQIHTRVTA